MNARARLDGADFHDAYLVEADFFGASVVGGNFNRADLRRATLCSGNFAGARFIRADLRGADLRGAALSGADLRAADLRGAKLTWCDLESALLSGASLDRNPKRASRFRRAAEAIGAHAFADALELLPHGTMLRKPTLQAMLIVEGVTFRRERLDEQLVSMFLRGDYYMHIVAAATLMLMDSDRAVETAWDALPGTWSGAQVAAMLSRRDPAFARRAAGLKLKDRTRDAVNELIEGRDGPALRWLRGIESFERTVL
jgi:hypothetical protein